MVVSVQDAMDEAIRSICKEVSRRRQRRAWFRWSEQELLKELAACILSSRVPFDLSLAATEALANADLLKCHNDTVEHEHRIERVLARPLECDQWPRARRYRFPKTGAMAIARVASTLYGEIGSIRSWLRRFDNSATARRFAVEHLHGVGPKQASLFLRNICYPGEVAVLDSHILRFMHMRGLSKGSASVSGLAGYERVEATFLHYASRHGYSPEVFDRAVWVVMRVWLREATWLS